MRRFHHVLLIFVVAFLITCHAVSGATEEKTDKGLSRLSDMSLEDLTELEITSVSKREEKRTSAAAAIHVITHEDIRRSTATSLPDLLRMVPGLHVASLDANTLSISSRGFGGRYASSLLVLVDGRSIYTPLFSGVEWEHSDLMLEDIERIEIIRGPGGTLWGANAVNGVINVITKSALDTQGGLLSIGGGTEYPGFGALRYGGTAGEDGHYRLYLRHLARDEGGSDQGRRADDDGIHVRGGLRADWDWDESQFTLIGNLYGAQISQIFEVPSLHVPISTDQRKENYYSGGSLLGRWSHTRSSGGQLRVQAFYDRSEFNTFLVNENRDTIDLEMQYHFPVWGRHEFTWGLGMRYYDDRTDGTALASFSPENQRKRLFSGFLQDRISFQDDELVLTLGTKLEHNDFTGVEIQPSARLAWTPNERHTLWAAVSRAVRTPSLVEETGRVGSVFLPGVAVALFGNDSFDAEQLLAFEAGYRVAVSDELDIDLALFYNRYDGLRSLELDSPFFESTFQLAIPFRTRNNLDGRTYGLELGLDWMPATWWRVRLNYSLLEMDLDLNPDTIDIVSGSLQESSPEQQIYLSSHFDLMRNIEIDLALRYTDQLAALGIDDYVTMDARVAWRPSDDFEIAIIAHDLMDDAHKEYDSTLINTVPTLVQRGVYGKVTWRF